MSDTTSKPSDTKYSVGPAAQGSIERWKAGAVRPNLLLVVPTRDVGECDLIKELADASYRLRGFRDAKRRHFVSRSYPRKCSEFEYATFVRQSFDAAEVTNGLQGVDNIDLTDWVGTHPSHDDTAWKRLTSYVAKHWETDFVFHAYTGDLHAAGGLASVLSADSGTVVITVELECPSIDRLASAFVDVCPSTFASYGGCISDSLSKARDEGRHLSYATVRCASTLAMQEAPFTDDLQGAIETAIEQAAGTGRARKKTFQVGFTGGER